MAVAVLTAGAGAGDFVVSGASAGGLTGVSRRVFSRGVVLLSREASASIVLSRLHSPSATAIEIISAAATNGQ